MMGSVKEYPSRPSDYSYRIGDGLVEFWWKEKVVANRSSKIANPLFYKDGRVYEVVTGNLHDVHTPEVHEAFAVWLVNSVMLGDDDASR